MEIETKYPRLIYYMINTNLLFLYCFLNWIHVKNGRNILVKLKKMVLNNSAMTGDQIKLNDICHKKSQDHIRNMPPPKR